MKGSFICSIVLCERPNDSSNNVAIVSRASTAWSPNDSQFSRQIYYSYTCISNLINLIKNIGITKRSTRFKYRVKFIRAILISIKRLKQQGLEYQQRNGWRMVTEKTRSSRTSKIISPTWGGEDRFAIFSTFSLQRGCSWRIFFKEQDYL